MPANNPYQAPQTTGRRRTLDWPTIVARSIAVLLILWAVVRYFERGVIAIGLLAFAAALLAAGSVQEALFGPNPWQMRRRIKQRLAERAANGEEDCPPPGDFLRQLEEDDG